MVIKIYKKQWKSVKWNEKQLFYGKELSFCKFCMEEPEYYVMNSYQGNKERVLDVLEY